MNELLEVPNTRLITVFWRIAAGSTTLAVKLAQKLGWKHIEGGAVFWEAIRKQTGLAEKDTNLRPDKEDILFEEKQKDILLKEHHIVLESHLCGFIAQGIQNIFKILVICENSHGVDQPQIRIDRLINREGL